MHDSSAPPRNRALLLTAGASRLRGSPLPCGTRPSPSSLFLLLLLHIHSSSSSATAALYTTGHGNPSRVSLGSPPVSLLHHDSLWNSRQQWQQQQCDSQPPPAAAALYSTSSSSATHSRLLLLLLSTPRGMAVPARGSRLRGSLSRGTLQPRYATAKWDKDGGDGGT
ncbi:unnamed protein product [Lampetra planeri]